MRFDLAGLRYFYHPVCVSYRIYESSEKPNRTDRFSRYFLYFHSVSGCVKKSDSFLGLSIIQFSDLLKTGIEFNNDL